MANISAQMQALECRRVKTSNVLDKYLKMKQPRPCKAAKQINPYCHSQHDFYFECIMRCGKGISILLSRKARQTVKFRSEVNLLGPSSMPSHQNSIANLMPFSPKLRSSRSGISGSRNTLGCFKISGIKISSNLSISVSYPTVK